MLKPKNLFALISAALLLSVLGGCTNMPNYKYMDDQHKVAAHDVAYNIDPLASFGGLDCLAIMPLQITPKAAKPLQVTNMLPQSQSFDMTDVSPEEIYAHQLGASEKQAMMRKMLFAYVAPYDIRDIELSQIDRKVITAAEPDYHQLAKDLNCNWFLQGTITKFDVKYFGVYSNIVIAADLQIVLADDGSVIWQGSHEARSDGGALPLSVVDIAMGAVKAASIINPDQLESVVSDLARRLTRTMPLEEDNSFLFAASRRQMLEVVASSLNLRNGPGQKFAVNHILKNREQVAVLESDRSKSWLLVQTIDGHKGYVSSQYLN